MQQIKKISGKCHKLIKISRVSFKCCFILTNECKRKFVLYYHKLLIWFFKRFTGYWSVCEGQEVWGSRSFGVTGQWQHWIMRGWVVAELYVNIYTKCQSVIPNAGLQKFSFQQKQCPFIYVFSIPGLVPVLWCSSWLFDHCAVESDQ